MKAKILYIIFITFLLLLPVYGFSQISESQKYVFNENQSSRPKGMVCENTVSCAGLMNNILNDSPERTVSVYLPPDYFINPDRRYPVIYILGAYTAEHDFWFGGCDPAYNLCETLDYYILLKKIQPFIVVSPSNCNKYMGSWFTNSSLAGNWETFNAVDLVNYIDSNYRTIAEPESRGITGCSMGGYGAVKLAMKYPEVFSCMYSVSADMLDFTTSVLDDSKTKSDFIYAARMRSFMFPKETEYLYCFGAALAFSPDNNSIGFGELPFLANGVLNKDVWQKWLNHNPVSMVPDYKENLKKLKAIALDYNQNEMLVKSGNISFSKVLTNNNITHSVNVHQSDQDNYVFNRMETHVFPFFSANLASQSKLTSSAKTEEVEFSVFPNPASESIIIRTYGKIQYTAELSALSGALILQQFIGKDLHKIDISGLNSGMYILTLKANGFVTTRKITKL